MCLKGDANSDLSGFLWDSAHQLPNCSRKYGGEMNEDVCNRKLASHRIRTLTPGWEPAVITTGWDPAEREYP